MNREESSSNGLRDSRLPTLPEDIVGGEDPWDLCGVSSINYKDP